MDAIAPPLALTAPAKAPPRAWLALGVLALPTLLIAIDVSVMILALPQIGIALGATSSQSLWIMDIYGFMLAGFSITMGSLADRAGSRKVLFLGAGAFALASVAAAFSPNVPLLIAARAVLGVAGATISPAILGLISTLFANPKERAFAIGIWMACFMGGMSLGPLAGGAMLQHFWWGSVFLLGVPAMVPLLLFGPALLPERRADHAGPLDLLSVALSLAAILPVVYAIKETARGGFAWPLLAALVAGLAFGVAFAVRQRRLEHPLLDLGLFRAPAFSAMLAANFLVASTGSVMLFVSQYAQLVARLSPLAAGLVMLPGPVAMMAGVLTAPLVARRFAIGPFIAAGLAVAVGGLLVLAVIGGPEWLLVLVAAFAFYQLGCAPMVALSTDVVIGAAPKDRAGSAGAVLQIAGDLAFSLGIAVLGSIGIAVYRAGLGDALSGLPPGVAARAAEDLAGAAAVAPTLPPAAGEALRATAEGAFLSAFHVVAFFAAAALTAVAVLCFRALRGRGRLGSAA
ncbi:MAG: MFS transporter [Bauldia sp.]